MLVKKTAKGFLVALTPDEASGLVKDIIQARLPQQSSVDMIHVLNRLYWEEEGYNINEWIKPYSNLIEKEEE